MQYQWMLINDIFFLYLVQLLNSAILEQPKLYMTIKQNYVYHKVAKPESLANKKLTIFIKFMFKNIK